MKQQKKSEQKALYERWVNTFLKEGIEIDGFFFLWKYWAIHKKTGPNSGQLKKMEFFFSVIYFVCIQLKPLCLSCKANPNDNFISFLPTSFTLKENSYKSYESLSLQCQKAIMYVTWTKKDEVVVCQMNLFLKYTCASVKLLFFSQRLMIHFAYETFSCQAVVFCWN